MKLRYIILSLLFLPFFEFGFFGVVSDKIGIILALLTLVGTSSFGMFLLKSEGRRLVTALKTDMTLTGANAKRGLMTALAGLLFAFPGFLSDILALFCLIMSGKIDLPIDVFRPKPKPQDDKFIDLEPTQWREQIEVKPKAPRKKKIIE
jgi:hypothetical protein